jgi:ankyrin repeat protein
MYKSKLFAAVILMAALLVSNAGSEAEESQAVDNVTSQMSMGALPTNPERQGWTELMEAARIEDLATVNVLLRKGTDVNVKEASGSTALMVAAFKGNLEIVKVLMDKGADVNLKDKAGGTALSRAISFNHMDIAQFLLEKGAKDDNSLFLAITFNYTSIMRGILKNGINVNNSNNRNGQMPLMFATSIGRADMVEILINNGAEVNITDNEGMTALMYAVKNGHLAIAKSLLDQGANVNIKNNNGQTALDLVDKENGEDNWFLKTLLKHEANRNTKETSKEIVSVKLVPKETDNVDKGIIYWTKETDSIGIHIYLPNKKKDDVFLKVKGNPHLLEWTKDMKTLFLISGSELFKVEWKWGAKPEKILSIPSEAINATFKDTYIDKKTNLWRTLYISEGFHESDIVTVKENKKEKYYLIYGSEKIYFTDPYFKNYGGLAILQEYNPIKGWQIIEKRMTSCNSQSAPCMDIMNDLYTPLPMISNSVIIDHMRIENKLETAEWAEGTPERGIAYIPSKSIANITLKVNVNMGDSYHAITPLRYVDKKSNIEKIIYDANSSCNDFDQLGFEEYGGFLLVGTEYNSQCARVIDMKTGSMLLTIPPDSSAFWVDVPRN